MLTDFSHGFVHGFFGLMATEVYVLDAILGLAVLIAAGTWVFLLRGVLASLRPNEEE